MMYTKLSRDTVINNQNTQSGNPILPFDELIPDVEARVYTDKNGDDRVYLYGSRDEFGSKTWCSYSYKVFSSSVSDLKNWTDHGISFASRKVKNTNGRIKMQREYRGAKTVFLHLIR